MEKIELVSCEISLTDHCNLRCVACNHSSPLLAARFTPWETIVRDIESIAQVVSTKELRISGGEPLLHPDIVKIVDSIRAANLAQRITLITNGVLLHKLSDELLNGIDRLWISTYPGIRYKWDENELRKTLSVHKVGLWVRRVSKFSNTYLNQRNEDDKTVKKVFRQCRIVHDWGCNFIYEGRLYKCTVAPFVEDRLALLGTTVRNKEADSISIIGNPNLRNDILEFLKHESALEACAFCLGTSGKHVRHRQIGRDESELNIDTSNVAELISWRKSMVGEIMTIVGRIRGIHRVKNTTKWKVRYSVDPGRFRKSL